MCWTGHGWTPSGYSFHFAFSYRICFGCWQLTLTSIYYCLSILQVNNAGIVGKGTIENTSLEDFDKVMNINMRLVLFPFTCQVSKLHMYSIVWNIPEVHCIIFLQSCITMVLVLLVFQICILPNIIGCALPDRNERLDQCCIDYYNQTKYLLNSKEELSSETSNLRNVWLIPNFLNSFGELISFLQC